jgi:hypothetical protein
MIPVVAGGLRETSLVPEDLPPLTKNIVLGMFSKGR